MKNHAVSLTSLFETRQPTSLKALGLPVPPGTPPCDAQRVEGKSYRECPFKAFCCNHAMQCEAWQRYEAGPDEFSPRHVMAVRPLERQKLTPLPRNPFDRPGDTIDRSIDAMLDRAIKRPPLRYKVPLFGDYLIEGGVENPQHWGCIPGGLSPHDYEIQCLEEEADAAMAKSLDLLAEDLLAEADSPEPESPQQ